MDTSAAGSENEHLSDPPERGTGLPRLDPIRAWFRNEAPYLIIYAVIGIYLIPASGRGTETRNPPSPSAPWQTEDETKTPDLPLPGLMTPDELREFVGKNPAQAILLAAMSAAFLVAFACGTGILLWWLLSPSLTGKPLLPSRPWLPRRWGLWGVLKTVGMYQYLVLATMEWMRLACRWDVLRDWLGGLSLIQKGLLLQFPASILIGLYVLYLVRFESGHSLREAGFGLALKPLWIGLLGYLAAIPVVLLAMVASLLLMRLGNQQVDPHPILVEFGRCDAPLTLAAILLFACVIAPIWEEMLFRTILYSACRNHVRASLAILLTASLFAMAHQNPFQFWPILVLGIMLGYLYEKTRSIWSCIAAHSAFNSGMMLALIVSKLATPVPPA